MKPYVPFLRFPSLLSFLKISDDFMCHTFVVYVSHSVSHFLICSDWKRLETGGITKCSHALSFLQI